MFFYEIHVYFLLLKNEDNSGNKIHHGFFDVIPPNNAPNYLSVFLLKDNGILLHLESSQEKLVHELSSFLAHKTLTTIVTLFLSISSQTSFSDRTFILSQL